MGDKITFDYTHENSQKLIEIVKSYRCDFGGTDILRPLKDIFESANKGHGTKRVFLLTDG